MLGRELRKDEEVHHKDQDRRNFWFSNLFILGSWDHGWVSAKQAYFMRTRDAREKQEWDQFMAEQGTAQANEIAAAKAEGYTWRGPQDGALQVAWEKRNGIGVTAAQSSNSAGV